MCMAPPNKYLDGPCLQCGTFGHLHAMSDESCAVALDEAIELFVDLLVDPHDPVPKVRASTADGDVLAMLLALFTEVTSSTVSALSITTPESTYLDSLGDVVAMIRRSTTANLQNSRGDLRKPLG